MPVTNARRSRELDMISDLENMDVTIGSGNYGREESVFGNSVRRPGSTCCDAIIDHNSNSHSTRERMISENEVDSGSQLKGLSGDLNQGITQE